MMMMTMVDPRRSSLMALQWWIGGGWEQEEGAQVRDFVEEPSASECGQDQGKVPLNAPGEVMEVVEEYKCLGGHKEPVTDLVRLNNRSKYQK